MKVALFIETGDGRQIASYAADFEHVGEVVVTASQADMLMSAGLTYEQTKKLLNGWYGIRFRAKVEQP